jgi:pyruvate dehydrogenase E2 component (dihydrolipoamide acetyltransferase)
MSSSLYSSNRGSGASALVLLHGFGANHAVWNDVVAELSKISRSIAYDLPGHGRSLTFPDAGPPKLAARAIAADLAERGINQAHLVGHSMGGAIAVLIGLMAPERVASLTLLAPGGFGPEINGPLLRRYGAAVEESEIRDCIAAMSGPQATVSEKSLAAYRKMRGQPGQTAKLEEIAALITKGERQGEIPREMLATLAMPVSVLWGGADPVLPVRQTEGLPAHFNVQLIPGAGHMLIGEAPAEVAALIQAQLAGISAR